MAAYVEQGDPDVIYVDGSFESEEVSLDLPRGLLTFRWSADGTCTVGATERSGVYGRVKGEIPRHSEVWVQGCGTKTSIDDNGEYFVYTTRKHCELSIIVLHQGLVAEGPAVETSPDPAIDVTVDLVPPGDSDFRPWTSWEYFRLLVRVELARLGTRIKPNDPWYEESYLTLESFRREVEAARLDGVEDELPADTGNNYASGP